MSDQFFRDHAVLVMQKLVTAFDLKAYMAAGIMGNLGHESGGLTHLREIGQPEGRGGYGWAQWTGPRARSFLAWCNQHGLDWHSVDGNLGYLIHELGNDHQTISALLKTTDVQSATISFERNYERAGVISMHSRLQWANIAYSTWTLHFAKIA